MGPHEMVKLGSLAILLLGCNTGDSALETPPIGPTHVLAATPSISIGGAETRNEYMLSQTLRALRLPDGQIVVADGMSLDIRYYDGTGQFVRRVGRKGQGPGEFERLTSLTRTADGTVVTWDRTQNRFTFFSATGDVLSTVTISGFERIMEESARSSSPFFVYPEDVVPLAGARAVAIMMAEPKVEDLPSGPVMIQDTLPIYIGSQNGGAWEVGPGPYPGKQWYFSDRRGRLVPAYGERLEYAAADSILYVLPTRSAVIHRVSAISGEASEFVTLPVQPRALSAEHREEIRTRMLRTHTQEAYEAMPLAPTMPLASDLLVSEEGDLWVQLFRAPLDPGASWLIFDSEGDLVGSLEVPGNLRVLDVGRDYLIALTTDDLGLETIHLYAITPAESV